MNVTHAPCELLRQIMARKRNVDQGGGWVAMAGALGNLVQIPAGSREVCKAKVAKGVGGELREIGLQR
jgi:hypothetical protein